MAIEIESVDRSQKARRSLRRSELQIHTTTPIVQSWNRCQLSLDRKRPSFLLQTDDEQGVLAGDDLRLISQALPVMKKIFPYLGCESSVMILVNSTGKALKILGSDRLLNLIDEKGIKVGVNLSEDYFGTNAFAVTLVEHAPIDVRGKEHFDQSLQRMYSAAAPILDEKDRLLGAIGLIDVNGQSANNSLAFVVAGAMAIERQQLVQNIKETRRPPNDFRRFIHHPISSRAGYSLREIQGESTQIMRVMRMIDICADAQASVLISGESGSGLSMLARVIHANSKRRKGPFILFPCAAIPEEFATMELLGYDDDLLANGVGNSPGRLELAEGGSIYFEGIEHLSLETQHVLLEILKTGSLNHIGGKRSLQVHVRILSSTSCDLEKLVTEGAFLQDLLYRLRGFEISVPPLRERAEDIPILVEGILQRLAERDGRMFSLVPETLDLLMAYSWPGNIRELEVVLEQASARADWTDRITPDHLPEKIRQCNEMNEKNEEACVPLIDELQRKAILKAAEDCKGNTIKMAKMLGIGRSTLWRWLKRMDVSVASYRSR